MYDLKRTHASIILEKDVKSGETIATEGACLIRELNAAGNEVIANCTGGASGERFVGFAQLDNQVITTEVGVEAHTVPASGTLLVALDKDAISTTVGDVRVVCNSKDTAAGTLTVVTGTPITGEVQADYANGDFTFHTLEAGSAATFYYRRNMTPAEVKSKYHERNVNNSACSVFGRVGVMGGRGEIFFDQYYINDNYATLPLLVKTAHAGRVAKGWTGAVGDTVGSVIKSPTVADPFIGIAYNSEEHIF